MSLYGTMEVAYYQLTPLGVQRAQNPRTMRGLDAATQSLLKEIASRGGTMEWDEMKFMGSIDSPTTLSVALKRLVDLGYVVPVNLTGGQSEQEEIA